MAWGEQPLFRERQGSEARAFRPPETWRGGGGGGTPSSSSCSPLGCGLADPELGGHGPAPRPRSSPGTGEAVACWGQCPAPGRGPLGTRLWPLLRPGTGSELSTGRFFLMGSQPHLWGLSTPRTGFRCCRPHQAAPRPCGSAGSVPSPWHGHIHGFGSRLLAASFARGGLLGYFAAALWLV